MMVAGGLAYERGRRAGAEGAYDDQAYADEPPPAPPPPAPASGNDDIGELQRLADLHSSGALTDDEFAAAKAKVLGS
jgi:hypothetical protein